ncbi:hypothetical protein [Flavobacterium sp.]|uniref:hypothetical protein n=1 Tax=Flavobacterium sp. TaxID=239 RepID=UPI0037530718
MLSVSGLDFIIQQTMNYRIETVEVKLGAGNKTGSNSLALPQGFLLGVNAFIQTEGQYNLFLNVGIKDDAGASVNKVSDIRLWKPRQGGSFHQSYVPINTKINGLTYIFEVGITKGSATANVDTYVQFVLYYAQPNQENNCQLKQ